jgi:hypothetical protein
VKTSRLFLVSMMVRHFLEKSLITTGIAALSFDGNSLTCGTKKGQMKRWDVASGSLLWENQFR